MLSNEEKQQVVIRIVDDDIGVREAISFDLECRGWITRTYESAKQFLASDDKFVPGCLVLDIPIIILTGHGDLEASIRAFKYGAFDFMQKPVDVELFAETVEKASELSFLQTAGFLTPKESFLALNSMSEREEEVIQCLLQGLENREIAEKLSLSLRTIQGHRNNIYRKLRVHCLEDFIKTVERAQNYQGQLE